MWYTLFGRLFLNASHAVDTQKIILSENKMCERQVDEVMGWLRE